MVPRKCGACLLLLACFDPRAQGFVHRGTAFSHAPLTKQQHGLQQPHICQTLSTNSLASAVCTMKASGIDSLPLTDGMNRRKAIVKSAATFFGLVAATDATTANAKLSGGKLEGYDGPTITYLEFNQLLLQRKIESAKFFGASLEACIVTLKDGEGDALVAEGYPLDDPASDASSFRVLAQLRNAGVPFKTSFSTAGYKMITNSQSKDEIAAAQRQAEEDTRVDEMMKQRSQMTN